MKSVEYLSYNAHFYLIQSSECVGANSISRHELKGWWELFWSSPRVGIFCDNFRQPIRSREIFVKKAGTNQKPRNFSKSRFWEASTNQKARNFPSKFRAAENRGVRPLALLAGFFCSIRPALFAGFFRSAFFLSFYSIQEYIFAVSFTHLLYHSFTYYNS